MIEPPSSSRDHRDHGICKSSEGISRCGFFTLGSGASGSGSQTRIFLPTWPDDSLTHQGTSTAGSPEPCPFSRHRYADAR